MKYEYNAPYIHFIAISALLLFTKRKIPTMLRVLVLSAIGSNHDENSDPVPHIVLFSSFAGSDDLGGHQNSQLQAPRIITQPSAAGSGLVSEGRTKILQCQALGNYLKFFSKS
jgi:hypothetical protein